MLFRAQKFSYGAPPREWRGSDPSALLQLTLATIAFPLIVFAPGIISVFYLMFPAGFYDIHRGHNKKAWE